MKITIKKNHIYNFKGKHMIKKFAWNKKGKDNKYEMQNRESWNKIARYVTNSNIHISISRRVVH